MKKIFSAIFTVIALCLFAIPAKTALALGEIQVSSKSAYLMDFNSGTVIYSKNSKDRLPIASMTKIMLLNLCFEKLEEGEYTLDDYITVSENASGMGGSQVFLESNKDYKAGELIKSIIVASANDASVAMAERLYGSEDVCVEEMNNKCNEWGLGNTLFSNCTGLPKPTQYSCAEDVAKMLGKLLTHKDYFTYSGIWIDEIEHEGGRVTGINNTNKLIRFYDGCDGGKTGYTTESGFCLAATAKRGAMRLISVVINAPDSKTRFAEVSNMLNYGFDNYTAKMVVDAKKPLDISVTVEKGIKDSVQVIPQRDLFVFAERNSKAKIDIDFKPYGVKAPIKKGEAVGELIVYIDNVEYAKVPVIAAEDVDKKTYFDYIKGVAEDWII